MTALCPALGRRQTHDERRIFLGPPDEKEGSLFLLRPCRDECLLLSWSASFVLTIRARIRISELLPLVPKISPEK